MRWIRALLLVWVSLGTGAVAQDRCALPAPMDVLFAAILTPDSEPDQIRAALRAVLQIPPAELRRIHANEDVARRLDVILTRTGQFVLQGRPTSEAVRSDVRSFLRKWDALCQTQVQAAFGPANVPVRQSIGPVPMAENLSAGISFLIGFQRMGAVMAGLIAFAITALVLEYGVKRALIYIFDRRSCMIAAHIQIGSDRIEGTITILSRSTFMFRPTDLAALTSASRMTATRRAKLLASDQNLPCSLLGQFERGARFVFTQSLPARTHQSLLYASTITPHYIGRETSLDTTPRHVNPTKTRKAGLGGQVTP